MFKRSTTTDRNVCGQLVCGQLIWFMVKLKEGKLRIPIYAR